MINDILNEADGKMGKSVDATREEFAAIRAGKTIDNSDYMCKSTLMAIMGRIAMPSLIMQAASPSLGALLIDVFRTDGALAALFVLAIVNVALVAVLYTILLKRGHLQGP